MKKIVSILVLMLLIATAISVANSVSACTGFTYDDENDVFASCNEDSGFINFNIRFFPPENNKNGMVFFEVAEPQPDGRTVLVPYAGMNDQGCWYSAYGTPYLKPVNSSDKPNFTNSDCYYKDNIAEYCTAECSTIVEVIDIIQNYNLESWSNFQVFVADKTGNSAIIEGDDIFYKERDFQVVSNFLLSHPELGDIANGFERYNIAISMLENMTEPSVEYFRDICNATHLTGTVYSMICDLQNQIIYLYYFHNYEKQVVIDLNEELQIGEHHIYLGSLFEPEGNQPPTKPEPPKGDESGVPGEDIEYSVTKTSDPERDKISYIFDWGDGTQSLWLYKTMGSIKASHNWTERGTYNVRVKARDMYGAESEWSDPLVVTMPKIKDKINPVDTIDRPFLNFLQNHPNLFLLLRLLLQRLRQ
jgi:hypothetical protein